MGALETFKRVEKIVSFGHYSLEPALVIVGQVINSTHIEVVLISG